MIVMTPLEGILSVGVSTALFGWISVSVRLRALTHRFNAESSRERRIRHLENEKQAKARKKAVKRTCLKVHKNNRNLHALVSKPDLEPQYGMSDFSIFGE